VLGSVSAVQIGRYSLDTKIIVQDAYEKWTEELSAAGHPVSFHFVEVSFAGIRNDDNRNRLYEIGTNFNLSDEDVDLLIASARQALRDSEEFQDFLSENRQIIDR
jgi:NTE family protein